MKRPEDANVINDISEFFKIKAINIGFVILSLFNHTTTTISTVSHPWMLTGKHLLTEYMNDRILFRISNI